MEEVAKYIFEAGMLKRTARSGWWTEKVQDPESVADHCFRTAIVAFFLARMEGHPDETARKLCTAAVFHDMHETRLGDMNKITQRYINLKEHENKVEEEQVKKMPRELSKSIISALGDLSDEERRILKDADYLECAFQAKEYFDIGHRGAGSWLESIEGRLQTKSARKLMAQVKKQDSNSWWKGLKKID
jgi:putative hydrolases of HD superfamily